MTCSSDAVADLLGLASGVLDTVSGDAAGQEIAWAAHEWATSSRRRSRWCSCFEDIHWAEEPLLDLVEHLADRVDDAPVLLVCLARPELLDSGRAGAGAGVRAITIELGPLDADESGSSSTRSSKDLPLADDLRPRCSTRPRGTRSSSRRRCGCSWTRATTAGVRIPDTLQALIAARIDRLPPEAKSRAAAWRGRSAGCSGGGRSASSSRS